MQADGLDWQNGSWVQRFTHITILSKIVQSFVPPTVHVDFNISIPRGIKLRAESLSTLGSLTFLLYLSTKSDGRQRYDAESECVGVSCGVEFAKKKK